MDIKDFLQWVVGGGGAVIIGSWLAERFPWFQSQLPDKKEWIFFGFTSIIWVAVYLVLNYIPEEFIDMLSPYFMGVSGLFVVVMLGKIFHKIDKVE